jgi:GNAT superfamily N-acetyltransferase
LSQIEFAYRSTPPIYAHPQSRTLAQARVDHDRLLDEGAVHFLARRDDRDVGLITVEFTSPAPRLCPNGQPYIGATATRPSVRSQGIGSALVHAVLDWAQTNGHATVSVDFDSSNPLSRPFWLGLGFELTGYRTRRSIDVSYAGTHDAPRRASATTPNNATGHVRGRRFADTPHEARTCRSALLTGSLRTRFGARVGRVVAWQGTPCASWSVPPHGEPRLVPV